MSERSTQKGDAEVGTCHVCGRSFATQEELSRHLIDAHDGPAGTTAVPSPLQGTVVQIAVTEGEPVGEQLGTDASAATVYDVPLARGSTLYVQLGDWAVYGAVAVLVVLGAAAGVRRLRGPAQARPVRPAHRVHESPGRPGH